VPLISNESAIGVVAVANRQGGYVHEDLQSLRDLAGAIVQAIVHKRTEAALAAELANNKRLQEISARLIHAGNVDALLSDILMAAIDFMEADAGHLQLYDADIGELRLLAQHGFKPFFLDSLMHGKDGERTSYFTALETGQRVVVPDIKTSVIYTGGPLTQIKLKAGLRAVQATPLISRAGLVLGVISTYWRAVHEPGHRELRFLDMLARQAADVIERQMNQNAILESHGRTGNSCPPASAAGARTFPDRRKRTRAYCRNPSRRSPAVPFRPQVQAVEPSARGPAGPADKREDRGSGTPDQRKYPKNPSSLA